VQKSTTAVDLALLILGALMEDCSGATLATSRRLEHRQLGAESGHFQHRGVMPSFDANGDLG